MDYKITREYSLKKGLLQCISTPYVDGDSITDLDGDFIDIDCFPIRLSALVEPKSTPSLDCIRFRIQSHSDTPLPLILNEAEFFISTIKKMYEL